MDLASSRPDDENVGGQIGAATLVRSVAEERRARLLIESLRAFGGRLSTCSVWIFYAEGLEPGPDGLCGPDSGLEGVACFPVKVGQGTGRYLFADKVQACAQAEEMADETVGSLLWLNPECLVVQPPILFDLGRSYDAAFRAVHIRNVGSLAAEPLDTFWQGRAEAALREGLGKLDARVRQPRESPLEGAIIVTRPATGEVLALVGGRDYTRSQFNRATQAMRQPGSTIKPFVYATGLEAGMTPASQVEDSTFCVYQGARLGEKCFRNFGGGGGGNHTMRWGLEQSRNLMTVRIANDTGMDRVTNTFRNVGIGDYKPYLAFALGAGETTVLRMVNAYSALANNGVQYEPSLIDYIQDRNGKVIWKSDKRRCESCNMAKWDGKPMPRIDRHGKEVMDPTTAYQVVHMLTGVVIRGTAVVLRDLDLPLFGKTGTTSGPTDVWFVGGSQDYVAGVYLGYDTPRSLGGYAQGGRFAAPIVKQLITETKRRWSHDPFVAPAGIRMVRIDRTSGKRVFGVEPGDDPKAAVIWEAFKPDTEPSRWTKADAFLEKRDSLIAQIRESRRLGDEAARRGGSSESKDFAEEQGGVY